MYCTIIHITTPPKRLCLDWGGAALALWDPICYIFHDALFWLTPILGIIFLCQQQPNHCLSKYRPLPSVVLQHIRAHFKQKKKQMFIFSKSVTIVTITTTSDIPIVLLIKEGGIETTVCFIVLLWTLRIINEIRHRVS